MGNAAHIFAGGLMTEEALRETREKFRGMHVISVAQFSPEDLSCVFQVADEFRVALRRAPSLELLKGRILVNLFYEPSTRTSSSFASAMMRLGGSVIPINEVHYSSVSKGESLPDTVRTLEAYADVIVLRHHETGAAKIAAQYARKPIINAGDGAGEHPTQALLDLYTILKERGTIEGLTVTLLGDLKHGRTVHSLARLLRFFPVKVNYVSPPSLQMPESISQELSREGLSQKSFNRIDEVIHETDVLYVTRVQKERFPDEESYREVQGTYTVDESLLHQAKKNLVIMHPLPRVGEISAEIDDDPRAAYFRQMEYGLFVRMALLGLVMGRV